MEKSMQQQEGNGQSIIGLAATIILITIGNMATYLNVHLDFLIDLGRFISYLAAIAVSVTVIVMNWSKIEDRLKRKKKR